MKSFFSFVIILLSIATLVRGTVQNGLTFKKIFFVLLENEPISVALSDPRMVELAKRGTLLTNLSAITNPSQPNYVGLVSGSTMGVHNDVHYDLNQTCLVDLFEQYGVSWKSYQENFPGACFSGDAYPYYRKHNPFISFNSVRNNATLCSKIVNATELYNDVQNDTVPRYSFYTPNMMNNGHDTGMAYASNWLTNFLTPLLNQSNFTRDNLVIVTFDEGKPGNNTIYTLLIHDDIPKGYVDHSAYSLYSLTKLVIEQFNLPFLGRNDTLAHSVTTQSFVSAVPTKVPTSVPTKVPTSVPTKVPTSAPSNVPTASPTNAPTITPAISLTAKTTEDTTIPNGSSAKQSRTHIIIGTVVGGGCAALFAVAALGLYKMRKGGANVDSDSSSADSASQEHSADNMV